MKKKIVLIVSIILILLIIGVISTVKKKEKPTITSDVDLNDITPMPFGEYQYDGTIRVYLENKTGEQVDKISIISYGPGNDVLSTTEFSGEDTEEDENNIIGVNIPDDKDAKWDLIITILGKEYKLENLVGEDTIRNQALIPFSIENDKLVVERDESFIN